MDYFTKNKMLFWCVIILVILNVVTLTSFWIGKPTARLPEHPGGERRVQKIMEEQLRLSAEQAERFEQIRNEHFMRTRPLQGDMHKIRLDLLDEIFASESDDVKIQELLAELGNKQNEFEKRLFSHFHELKEACNEQQTKELKYMLLDLIERTRPRDPRHHPPGPPPEFGPDHRPPPRR